MTPLNGFSGTVTATVSGLPSGVTSTPDTFTLDKNTSSQSVTLKASNDFNTSSFQYSLKGVSGTLSHQYNLSASSYIPPPILRNDFVDVGYSTYNFVNGTGFPGWHITIYDQTHKLFFMSVTFGNELVAYDAAKRQVVARIPVPAPYGMDFTQDGKFLLVATNTHFLYILDPATLQIHDRIDTTLWGSSGYTMEQPFGLVNNKIGFMAGTGNLYIWNPADNSVEDTGFNGWSAARSKDGTKLAFCSVFGSIGIYDVNTHAGKTADHVNGFGFSLVPAFHPTKNQFLVTGGPLGYTRAMLFDENLNVIHDTPQMSSYYGVLGVGYVNGVFSLDGSRLYLEDEGSKVVAVLDGEDFHLMGFAQRPDPSRNYLGLYSQAMDENNLLVGASHQGLVVVDPKYIAATPVEYDILFPGTVISGSTSGGSQVTFSLYPVGGLDNSSINKSTVSFDAARGSSVTTSDGDSGSKVVSVTTPPHPNGVVNAGIYFPDNGWITGANIYSFGPNIRDALTTASTAEGGPASIGGYGFENGLSLKVGANSAEAAVGGRGGAPWYTPDQYTARAATYTMPPGTPGYVDLVLQSDSGSHTYAGHIHYYPTLQKYPLTGGRFWDGLYDSTRKLVYLTNEDKIEVFDVAGRTWLQPITFPTGVYARSFRFLALSPNADYLAVTDWNNGSLVTIDLVTKLFKQEMPLVQVSPPTSSYQGGFPVAFTSDYSVVTVDPNTVRLTDVTTGNQIWTKGAGNLGFGKQAKYVVLDNRYFVSDFGYYIDLDDGLPNAQTHDWGCYGSEYENEISLSVENKLYMNGCVINADSRVENVTNISNAEWQSGTRRAGAVWDSSGTYLLMPRDQAVDVVDPKTGRVRERITYSAQIADTGRPVIPDRDDNLLILNLGDGIAVMDISALPIGIASVTPASGAAGTEITIHGTGFTSSTIVVADGQQVPLSYQDRNTLRFTAPTHAQGSIRITVSNTEGSDQLDSAFVYTSATTTASAGESGLSSHYNGLRATPPVKLRHQPTRTSPK